MAKKKTIVICSSGAFYRHVCELADELKRRGYNVEIPTTAEWMRQNGEYDIAKVKRGYGKDYIRTHKRMLAMEHFDKVSKGDAILLVNDDKPGKPRYIGPNGTMEWGLAYYLGKPVFILNGVNKDHNAYEEVYGMSTAVLDGDLAKIKL